MNDLRKTILLLGLLLLQTLGWSQQTTVYTDALLAFKTAEVHFEQGLYGNAQGEYTQVIELLRPLQDADVELLRSKAELGYAKSAVRLELPDGEKLMLDFIRSHAPDPISNQALIELANFYYNSKKYDKAVEYFSQIPTAQLSAEEKSEVRFKMGYAFFVRKKFTKAKDNFQQVKNLENEYYYPTNYYYGLCEFFLGNYDEAVRSFRLVERSRLYKGHVPYYVAQIYFAQSDYDQLVSYVEPKINDSKLKKRKELNQLLGQSYFEMGDYQRALPYLEYYAERSGKLREEEFYQLGFTQYKNQKYKAAVKSFEQLSGTQSQLGQYAMYYSGDAYLKIGMKKAARNAFGKARRLGFDPSVTEESEINFAKLSYETGYYSDAISSLQRIQPTSTYYSEAQSLMAEIFVTTRDYERAMTILEGINNKTPQLREAYQKVAYYRGMQLYRDNQTDQARQHFIKSNTEPINATIKASCIFWLGDIAHKNKQYNESIRLLNQFLTLSKTLTDLPEESSVYTANYTQGYNYLKQNNYTTALQFFTESVNGINRNKPFIRSAFVKDKVLGDATLRAGDCNFKRNRYNDAIRFYDDAIRNRYSDFVYALYQKAIIEGLRGNTTDKILNLEDIADNYAASKFADDALYALGVTYQEIGQLNSAIQPLRKLISDYAQKSDLVIPALIRLGLISYNQGNLQTSIEYYKQVFGYNPSPAERKSTLAALEEIYVDDLGDPDGYTRFLETIPGVAIDASGKDALNFRAAETQYNNGNYNRAIQGYDDYLRKFPNGENTLVAHFHRGECHFQLKQYAPALTDFEYVLNQGQGRYYAKSLRLAALISYNFSLDFNKSYSYYSKLEEVALDEDMRFEAQLGAMQSAYRINNPTAVTQMASKVANNPSANLNQRSIANFYLGKIAYDNKDYDAALAAFDQVIRLIDSEEAAEARYLIAEIYYFKRNLSAAEGACNQAIQDNSAYPFWIAKSMILLSDVYADMGDLFDARAVLEALIENYDGDQGLIQEAQNKLNALNQQANQSSRIESTDPNVFEFEEDGGN